MVEDALLEGSQLASRLKAEFVVERLTASAIDLQRLGLPSAAVQRKHQLPAQRFTMWMQGDERLELANQSPVLTAHEISFDTVLERRVPGLFEACDLDAGERLVRHIGERFAAPELERRAQQLTGARSIPARELDTSVSRKPREALGIDLSGVRREHVAAALRKQHPAAERPAKVRHIPLQRLGGARRRPLAPQLIDQPFARHHLAAAQHQDCQQRPLLRAAERNRPLPLDHLDRPQDTEVEHDFLGTPSVTLPRPRAVCRAPLRGLPPASNRLQPPLDPGPQAFPQSDRSG